MSPLNFQTNSSAPTATNIFNNIGRQNHLAYKMVRTESRIVHALCTAYGFSQAHPNSADFNLMWHGGHVKPITLRTLQDFQRVNHFPRSYELTRKDRMYANVIKMQQTHGFKNFDFVSKSFILPLEYQEFMGYYQREARKGTTTWIIKPVASSRGRGIYLANNINHIPLDENIIVGRYIDNPFTIDGFKFDIRLYVTVTSYDPLIIYLHEEGLTRFCTIKYDRRNNTRNLRMHLTNYSLNKKSMDYVRCDNPDVEDYGNKWSMSAMLRYLRDFGIDTAELCSRIEDVVIKAIIAVELPIATATKMFVPNPRGNCSELYGFDILVDENLKPWLLEVNLSPSLATDAPLDLKIKSHVVADWLNLTGLSVLDPVSKNKAIREENNNNRKVGDRKGGDNQIPSRPMTSLPQRNQQNSVDRDLSTDEARVLKWAREQNARRGGFLRIFPRPDSWEKYGKFLQYRTTYNSLLARRLFRTSNGPVGIDSKIHTGSVSSHHSNPGNSVNIVGGTASIPIVSKFARNKAMSERLLQYERKLLNMTELVEVKKQRAIKDADRASRPKKIRSSTSKNRSKSNSNHTDLKKHRLKDKETTRISRSKSSKPRFRDPKDQKYYEKEKLLEKRSKLPNTNTKIMVATKDIQMNAITLKSETVHNHVERVPGEIIIQKNIEGTNVNSQLSKEQKDKQLALAYKSTFNRPGSGKSRGRHIRVQSGNTATKTEQNTPERVKNNSRDSRSRSNSKERTNKQRPATAVNTKTNITIKTGSEMRIKSAHPGSGVGQDDVNNLINSHTNSANVRIKTKKIYQQLKITPAAHENFLSAIEARRAFHAYLTRVQIRLLKEATTEQNNILISEQKQENQLALVTRFLVRAAENLPTPLPITVPNKDNFNLITRKKLIASQLNIFVQRYQAETNRQEEDINLANNIETAVDQEREKDSSNADNQSAKSSLSARPSTSSTLKTLVCSSQHLEFSYFVKNASENELEDILTLYTKRNKSAAIFLGTKPPPKSKTIEITSRPTSTHNSYVDYIINEGKAKENRIQEKSKTDQKDEKGSKEKEKNQSSGSNDQVPKRKEEQANILNQKPSTIRHRPPSAPAKTKPSIEERKMIDALAKLNSNQKSSKTQLQEIKKLASLEEKAEEQDRSSRENSPIERNLSDLTRKMESANGNYKKMNHVKLVERAKTSLEGYADRKRAWY